MGQFYILSAIVLWSSLGIVVRLSDVPVHTLIFYSLIVAVAFQGMILFRPGSLRGIGGSGAQLKFAILLGGISLANSLTFFYAFKTTTIANAILTHYTAPVIVAFLAGIFLRERITPKLATAIGLASLGLWVMLDGLSLKGGDARGIMAGLASGLFYALIVIVARLHGRDFRPIMLSFIVNITMVTLLAPFIREFPGRAFWSFGLIGIVHSTLAPVLYYRGLREITATRTAVLGYLEPVCAILLSMIFFREIPAVRSLFGGVLILFSGYLTVSTKEQRDKR
jgi:drug/metabolite transporter (DMT)-like permease